MKTPLRYTISAMLLLILATGLIACGDDPVDNEDGREFSRITIVSGNNQSERIGTWLPAPLTIQVTDMLYTPRQGVSVEFSTEEQGAVVDPVTSVTDKDGYTSTNFKLGTDTGLQNVSAETGSAVEVFSLTALDITCDEESPERICHWPAGHIFITTTSSSMILGTGSVLIDFNPATGGTEKVLETTEIMIDLAFSPRGELFVVTNTTAYKVNPVTKTLEYYTGLPSLTGCEIEPNYGGVLVMSTNTNCYKIGCPSDPVTAISDYISVRYRNLGVDPVQRDFYMVTGTTPTHYVHRNIWNGRGNVESTIRFDLNTGVGEPRGMCVDSTGVLYISIDSNGNSRSVARIEPGISHEVAWFDFYQRASGNSQEAGRWGDITVLGNRLYLIDRRMDRLVVLWTEGTTPEEKWIEAHESDVFSLPYTESERYGISASSGEECPATP